MTSSGSHSLNVAYHVVAMARELYTSVDVEGPAITQARVAILLDTTATQLPGITEPDAFDADQRAHTSARLLSHAGRLLAELRFADWDAGETIAALVATAVTELNAASRALERQVETGIVPRALEHHDEAKADPEAEADPEAV